jgi:hypothetical protein
MMTNQEMSEIIDRAMAGDDSVDLRHGFGAATLQDFKRWTEAMRFKYCRAVRENDSRWGVLFEGVLVLNAGIFRDLEQQGLTLHEAAQIKAANGDGLAQDWLLRKEIRKAQLDQFYADRAARLRAIEAAIDDAADPAGR